MPPLSNLFAVVFTVALLATTAYFLLGSVPLLILKHDNPVDSNFIRSFFNTYYLIATFVATAATLSYAFSNRPWFAVGAAVIAILSTILRRTVMAKMDALKAHIHTNNIEAIPEFRKIHLTAIAISFIQLVAVLWGLTAFTL